MAPAIHDARQLSFTALVSELSQQPNLPTSVHVRNLLLSGLASQEQAPEELKNSLRDASPSAKSQLLWDHLRSYQPGIQVGVIGAAPGRVLGTATSTSNSPWGVAILKSSVFRTVGDTASYFKRPDFSLWISTESRMAAAQQAHSDQSTTELDVESLDVFKTIITQWLPMAHAQFQRELFEHFGVTADAEKQAIRSEVGHELNVLAFATENNVSDALLKWAEEEDAPVKVDWHATYGTLQRYEDGVDDGEDVQEKEQAMVGSAKRWTLERLGEESVEVVLGSNKLAFPRSHLLRKPFLTCLVRDTTGPPGSEPPPHLAAANNTYATTQGQGSAAGWVYTHEDLSLASLHVPPPYRRLTPKQEGVPSVGRLLMDVMCARLARHQRRILSLAEVNVPVDGKTCPVTADVEIENEASWQFYIRTGFVPVARHTWLGLRVQRVYEGS